MLLLAVTAYFLLACLISWLIVFPAGRAFVLHALAATGQKMYLRLGQLAQRQATSVVNIQRSGSNSLRGLSAFMRKRYLLVLGASALILLPPPRQATFGLRMQVGQRQRALGGEAAGGG